MSENCDSSIQQAIAKLRRLVQIEVQTDWHQIPTAELSHNCIKADCQSHPLAEVNDQQYIVFPQGGEIKWLARQIKIPSSVQGYPISGLGLRLVLTWWAADAQIFINGELVQQGDLFDSSARILVTANAQPGQEYMVVLRLVSPDHDIGALMRSHLIYEHPDQPTRLDPGLVADELTVLWRYLTQFEPERLGNLAGELERFDWQHLGDAKLFETDLAELRSRLLPLAKNIKQRCFNLLGHAHLDMAWLWTTEETYRVAERTFKSVLNLQRDFPELTFGHTSPALYQWLEINRPQLFKEIQEAVTANQWELLGGMWIEPETNLVSGESLIRQLLYGQRYYQEQFGQISTVAWLPDSFGFTWQLPQIASQCGIEYFVTGKLHWNDTTQFPHGCFWWQAPDGTQLLTLMSPPNITGVMDTNPLTMINYALDWERQTGLQEIFWLPGVGDHGGGPTRDMLEVAQIWQRSPFFPQLEFTTGVDYLEKIEEIISKQPPQADLDPSKTELTKNSLPLWRDELYLELHRGCYTVHADQKTYNRRCERSLYQAELWFTLASLLCKDLELNLPSPVLESIGKQAGLKEIDYQLLLEIAWKKVLFNQFHDILPGTSIPEVFIEANQNWQQAIAVGESILDLALRAIASRIKLPQPPQPNAQPVAVFNSLNWQRSAMVTVNWEHELADPPPSFLLTDDRGREITTEVKQVGKQLHFCAPDIPGVGYRLFWLSPQAAIDQEKTANTLPTKDNGYQLENQFLRVVINPQTGDIASIFDRHHNCEVLSAPGNKLQAFEDRGQYWDAWNIAPDYEQKPLPDAVLESIGWIDGELGRGIRVVRKLNRSYFRQDYLLPPHSPLLKIVNRVEWQETHVLVKVSFPLNLNSDRLAYEIPCGTMSRSTEPQRASERAKWEFAALNWADLTDKKLNYGVSLLNNCKHGYDAKPNELRLTLLRSPLWPDPQSDRGRHDFTYAIYPHQGSWQSASTVQHGYELNTPVSAVLLDPERRDHSYDLAATSQLLNLSANNLVLMALKLSAKQQVVLRCYESQGQEAALKINSELGLELDQQLNCLEQTNNVERQANNRIQAYKIVTFQLSQTLDKNEA